MTQQKCSGRGGGRGGWLGGWRMTQQISICVHMCICVRVCWGAGIRNWSVRPQADPPAPPPDHMPARGHSFLARPGLQPGRTEGAATCPKPEWARGRMAARGWLPKTQGVGGVERMSPGQPQTTCPSMLCVPECSTSELAFPSTSSGHMGRSLTKEEGRGQGLGRGCPRPANETGKTNTEVPGQGAPPRQVSPGEPS